MSSVYGNYEAVELFKVQEFLNEAKVALTLVDVIARSPNLVM